MVAVVSSNPTGGNFIFLFFKILDVNIEQKCQIGVENKKPMCIGVIATTTSCHAHFLHHQLAYIC